MTNDSDRDVQRKVDIRQQAEHRVSNVTCDVANMSPAEMESLVHELQVHQEELEIQNDELRRMQLELQKSRDGYVDLYDFAPAGYMTVAEDGSVIEANLTAATMSGVVRSTLIGSRLGFIFDERSRSDLNSHLSNVFSGEMRQSCELQINNPNGETLDVRLVSEFRASSNEKQLRIVMTDITDQKEAERSAIEKDRHLNLIADSLPVLISYFDRELRFVIGNLPHHDWFGIPQEKLIGQSIADVIGAESFWGIEDYFADAIRGNRVEFETTLEHSNRGQRWVHVILVPDVEPVENPTDSRVVRGVHSLSVDISERKLIDQAAARNRSFSDRLAQLNSKEKAVYDLLIQGESNKAIAHKLDIGLRTVERRRRVLLDKMNAETLVEVLQHLADIRNASDYSN
ncbi:MAG: PAS domain S-box-containing protein [Pirellulaceae bacterium]|jgi:PAS domain S-box-containing protein